MGKKLKILAVGMTPEGPGLLLEDTKDKETYVTVRSRSGVPLPPGGDIVRLHPIDEDHVESRSVMEGDLFEDHSAEASSEGHAGPAQVATPAYRESWERIFGKKSEKETN